MFEAATKAFTIPDIRRKILFTLGILVIFQNDREYSGAWCQS